MDQAAIVRTGVELSLDRDATDVAIDATHHRELNARERVGKVALLWARCFADLFLDGKPQRWHGNDRHTYIELDRDPTNQLKDRLAAAWRPRPPRLPPDS